jgi:hypothetical protein
MENKPHTFCESPTEKCTMNYCDESGCQFRKRELVEPDKMENNQTERIPDGGKTMSSIDWLGLELSKIGFFPSGIPDKIYEQAKEKHKQEIEKAYNKGWHEGWLDDIRKKPKSSEQYYNETFNPQSNGKV